MAAFICFAFLPKKVKKQLSEWPSSNIPSKILWTTIHITDLTVSAETTGSWVWREALAAELTFLYRSRLCLYIWYSGSSSNSFISRLLMSSFPRTSLRLCICIRASKRLLLPDYYWFEYSLFLRSANRCTRAGKIRRARCWWWRCRLNPHQRELCSSFELIPIQIALKLFSEVPELSFIWPSSTLIFTSLMSCIVEKDVRYLSYYSPSGTFYFSIR